MSEILVRCEHLHDQRGTFELRVPRWEVRRGEVVGVVGTNGAGKSSLLQLLIGLRRVTSGKVRVFDYEPYLFPREVRERAGFMTDDAGAYAVSIGTALHLLSGYYPSWDQDHCTALMERFRLDADAPTTGMSKGERTRFNLVACLAYRPELIILDEPGTGLDLAGRRELLGAVLGYMRDEGGAAIVSSHQLSDVSRLADQLLVLDDGKVIQQGDASELIGPDRTLEEAMVAWGLA